MKYAGASGDPYLDTDTGVLKNLLGIGDQARLEQAESNLSFLRTNGLHEHPVQLFGQLAKENYLRGLDADQFSARGLLPGRNQCAAPF